MAIEVPGQILAGIANPQVADIGGAFLQGQQRREKRVTRELVSEALKSTAGTKFEKLIDVNPEAFLQLAPALGIPLNEKDRIKSAFGNIVLANKLLQLGVPPTDVAEFLGTEASILDSQGIDTSLVQNAIQRLTSSDENEILTQVDAFAQMAAIIEKPKDKTAKQKEFESLTKGLPEEEKQEARLIALGLSPRAVGSAIQTISTQGIAEQIGDAEATIKERAKFGELTGSSRSKAIDSGFATIAKIDKNVLNLDKAIAAVEAGAGTGVIERRFPSFKAASVALDQIQGELALDVIGSVTFGALSEGELALAKAIALPTGLDGPQLIQHLRDRVAAQGKLRDYFSEQIDFLDSGGSVAGFLREKERQTQGQESIPGQGQTPAATRRIKFDAQGNIVQ